jgi:4-hydroxy-3-methylbut-2-enyl diphosphate reductase
VCQTTLSCGTVQDVLSALRARYPHLLESPASDTCTATRDRQRAVDDFVCSGDPSATGVLVIGSANSSNTARLVEIAREAGAAAWRVGGPDELASCDFAGIERLGLTAGASTPEAIVADIAARLGRI